MAIEPLNKRQINVNYQLLSHYTQIRVFKLANAPQSNAARKRFNGSDKLDRQLAYTCITCVSSKPQCSWWTCIAHWTKRPWRTGQTSVTLRANRTSVTYTTTIWPAGIYGTCMRLITGSIARSANLPVFSLLRGRFWGFSPRRGDTLHRCNDKGVGPPKLKFLLRFDRNLEYKRPCAIFTKFAEFVPHFRIRWVLKYGWIWSRDFYGGFKLRGSGFSQIFSAP